ncbi:pyruvate formate lyase activating enzyme [Actinocrispum wychmicini]|uniref:Pyruvate formate lyase activating enzyme n=1 Tax=Actinocrispum wychmicini TaxID=1213861 RepID=A0A4R2J602_9PSEU|nr:pyruvate formate lyase activating enzyme [Actinocrispum wychmicini]
MRRGSADGGLETATFASSVAHVDTVERKPFFHYRPGTSTVTLAAPGCSFRCDYCVNFRISQYGRDDESVWNANAVDPADIVGQAAAMGGNVALSYTEPSLAPELTLELARLGRDVGVEIVWKSNGFLTPEAVALTAPAVAAVNIDLKGVDEQSHRRLTGGSVRPVIETIGLFREHGTWVEVSTPIIPGVTEPARVADVLAGISTEIPWHLVRFTPAYRMRDEDPTSPDDIADAVAAGRAAGLKYVYVERALGDDGRATRCPKCGSTVLSRGVWSLRENRIVAGRCPDCGTAIEGRW